MIDSAIIYRFQRGERAIRAALEDLRSSGTAARDELVIATKAGFLSFDGSTPANPRDYFVKTYLDSGLLQPDEIAAGSHAMAPKYLANQLDRSLENLGLETIDIFYVHNPETQLEEIPHDLFIERLRAAFEFLESAVVDGKISMYGTATWNGHGALPQTRGFLSLWKVVECAREVAGDGHHFKVIQLPYNLAMREAFGLRNQKIGDAVHSTLEAAAELGISAMVSASLLQARLSRNLPENIDGFLPNLRSDPQRAIQFMRSTPGVASALVGMSSIDHVEENLYLAKVPTVSAETIRAMVDAA